MRKLNETQRQQYSELLAKLNHTQVRLSMRGSSALCVFLEVNIEVWYALGLQKTLEDTQDNLCETTESLKQANFAVRERDFVIANQREAGQSSANITLQRLCAEKCGQAT